MLMDVPFGTLAFAVLVWLSEQPIDTAAGMFLAMRMVCRGDRRYIVHAAYCVMACALSRRMRNFGFRHAHVYEAPIRVLWLINRHP